MSIADTKQKLVAACRQKLLESITLLEASMADAQQQANDYGPPKDRYDAFRSQLLRRKDMLAQQLDQEMNHLKTLDKIDLIRPLEVAGFGTLVITSGMNYFISIGQGKLELDGIPYYLISPLVPMSQALAGKKKGDMVEFRGNRMEIVDIG